MSYTREEAERLSALTGRELIDCSSLSGARFELGMTKEQRAEFEELAVRWRTKYTPRPWWRRIFERQKA